MFRKMTIVFAIIITFRIASAYAMEQEQSTLCEIPCEMLLNIAHYLPQEGIFNLASTCHCLYTNLREKRIFKISGSGINIIDSLRSIKEKKIGCQGITLLLIKKTQGALHYIFNKIDDEIKLKITKLYLINNNLLTLPEKIQMLTNLTELYLNDNKLNDDAIKMISSLTNLTNLSLKINTLITLPQETSHLSNLTHLDLEDNCLGIYNAPTGLGSVPPKLTQLSLSNNGIHALPEGASLLTNLTSLDLSFNFITESKSLKWLHRLTKLAQLSLRNCALDSLPEKIGYLSGLTSLNLSSNKLQTLPIEIEKLTKLRTLSIRGNKIPEETVDKLQKALPDTKITT